MNELTKKYRIKDSADFEIYGEYKDRYYGRVGFCPISWDIATLKSDFDPNVNRFDLELIQEETPQHDLKVDDLVWVWDHFKSKKQIACFANFDPNIAGIYVWLHGLTSASKAGRQRHINWEKYQPEQTPEAQKPEETPISNIPEKPDFETQQEIWAWLMDGNKVINIHNDELSFFENGKLHNSYCFAYPKDWKKYIEPKKTEWFDLLDGTEENAMVCWSTSMPYTFFVAFRIGKIFGDDCIYNGNQGFVYKSQLKPIMPLAEFKKLYPYPID